MADIIKTSSGYFDGGYDADGNHVLIEIVDKQAREGGGATYTAGDGIEINNNVISTSLAENGGLEFVDGKLSVAKAPTSKPFNEDTYNDFVIGESHNIQ